MPILEKPPNMEGARPSKPCTNKAFNIADPGRDFPMLQPSSTAEEEFGYNSYLQSPRQHRVNVARRLSGRPSNTTSKSSSVSQAVNSSTYKGDLYNPNEMTGSIDATSHGEVHHQTPNRLISQILGWLHEEKAKRNYKHGATKHLGQRTSRSNIRHDSVANVGEFANPHSELVDEGLALEKLEQILVDNHVLDSNILRTPTKERSGSYFPRRPSTLRKLKRGSTAGSSDTEYMEGDALVPTTEVILDNSKTLSYTGGGGELGTNQPSCNQKAAKEKESWLIFKNEIVRLAHTLRLKGWRKVPLDRGGDVDVERLSGALTNAVYVVSPPKDLPHTLSERQNSTTFIVSRKPPPKLLLRIYGPQVEHLIDRESELQILRRLARKRIGPRLLGTFTNGRFEQFFHARTLTARDLRMPETSKQIAKRMRELHDGIELLDEERDGGPFVWRNWDKWVDRCEKVIKWVDRQMLLGKQEPGNPKGSEWKKRGLVCGVEWTLFRRTVDRYREWLNEQYGGKVGLRQQLVFAHNDTQYGNLLRLEPSGESPLLLPANEHKQLVVIDFEYASANVPGLEFANHFTEWCYNYHDPEKPYACNTRNYPNPEEQHRFLKAYIQHRPQFHPRASATPAVAPSPGPSGSISSFMLDSRAPPTQIAEEESRAEEAAESEVRRLMHETRLWRIANSAQWVAWGIVQAKVDGMDEGLKEEKIGMPTSSTHGTNKTPSQDSGLESTSGSTTPYPSSDPLTPKMSNLVLDAHDKRPDMDEEEEEEEKEEEFDYLAYARERAMFFWGDVLSLGVVKKEEVPKELLESVKVVEY